MKLLARIHAWRYVRRARKHREWLRRNKVITTPAEQCRRNSTEAVTS